MLRFYTRKTVAAAYDYEYELTKEMLNEFFEWAMLDKDQIKDFFENEDEYADLMSEWIEENDIQHKNEEKIDSESFVADYWFLGEHHD